jgi:nitrous oxidase accessory protein NosD
MKKACIAAVILIISIVIVSMSVLLIGEKVSGNINSDTTWSGTINLQGNITVSNGATLTIKPRTTVNLGTWTLQIDGTLIAKGTNFQRIQLNGGKIIFTANSTPWNEQTDSGCMIDNAISSSYLLTRSASAKISNCILNMPARDSRILLIDGGAPIISNNQVIGNVHPIVYGLEGGDGIDFWDDSNATISGNTIKNCMCAISISYQTRTFTGTVTIEHNLIISNPVDGVYFGAPQKVVFQYNTITQNRFGLRVSGYSNQSTFEKNNIYGNTNCSITLEATHWTTDMTISNNWWGTTDTNAIAQSILDSKTNPKLGTVDFRPVLNASVENAPKPWFNIFF